MSVVDSEIVSNTLSFEWSLLQIIREIKKINKVLLYDKKQSPFSSHNKYQTYQLRATLPQVKSLIPTMKLVSIVQTPNSSPYIKCSIQTLKKMDLLMNLCGLELVNELEYEENPLNPQEYSVSDESQVCYFKKASFVGTLDQLKHAITTLKHREVDPTIGSTSTLIFYFYVSKEYQLQVHFPWNHHSGSRNFFWTDVTTPHTQKQNSNAFKMSLTLKKLLTLNPTLTPPAKMNKETEWRLWRRFLFERKKELQDLKARLVVQHNTTETRSNPRSYSKSPSRTSMTKTTFDCQSATSFHSNNTRDLPPSPPSFPHHRNSNFCRSSKTTKLSMSPNWKPKFFPTSQLNTVQQKIESRSTKTPSFENVIFVL